MPTDNQEYQDLQKIFLEAVELRSPNERAAYLDKACSEDSTRRDAIDALLKEYEEGRESVGASSASADSPVTPDSAMFVPGKILADRYRIVTLLGKGGMGEVYRADDLKLEQPVALKFLPTALAHDERLLKTLYNEVRLARRVTHRNVGRVYDIGEAEGLHFLSMEYIEGEDLGALLKQIGRLPGDKAISLAQQLCAGLQAAHEKGLLHLDLKPGNLMIDHRGDLRVTDFGLARMTREAEVEKRRSGTPTYMAPEQLLHGEASERSDLYAVGLILFEMFTGRRMHGTRTAEEMVGWHKTAGRASQQVLESASHLGADVKALIFDCTVHDPQQRHASVGAIMEALEKLAPASIFGGLPIDVGIPLAPPTEELKFSDVFIAYAPVDDKPLVAGKPGWIAQFHDHLQVRLEQLSGEDIKIWRDVSPQAGEPDEELLENLPSAKTMVSIMSPPFVKAAGCMQEVDTFWKSAERSGTFRVSDKTRILKVMKTPVASGVASPDIERLMSQLAGFEFYETDQQTGRVFAYDETFGDKAMQRYFEKVYDLAYEIRDVLQALEGSGHGARSITGKTVYLAETTADLRSERDKLRRELLENGHRVLPELPLPLSGIDFEKEVCLLLEESDFAVHLVGERYGMVPEDMQSSVVEIQNRVATERAASDGLERLIWMPRSLKPKDERQVAFVRRLIEDPDAHRGGEVVQDTMETFKQMLLETLTPPPQEEAIDPSPRSGKEGVPSVYLIYDRRDEEAIEPLEDLLFELGFEVTSPSFEGDEDEAAKVHQHNLQHCDGALVFYGSVNKPWVDMKLMDIAQAPGYGRSKELLATGVYVMPSDDRRKARFRTHLADVIRPESADMDAAELKSFTANLQHL